MKLLVAVLFVFVVIVCTGSRVGETSTDKEVRICPIVLEEGESAEIKLYNQVQDCLKQTLASSLDLINLATATSEDIRMAFSDYCGKLPKYTLCLDYIASDAKGCVNKIQQTRFRLFHNYKELDFKIGCAQNGDVLAQVFEAININKSDVFETCERNAYEKVREADDEDVNGQMFFEYMALEKMIECLGGHKGQGLDTLLDSAILVAKEVMGRMNCFQGGADVLCKTIIEKHYVH